MMFYRVHRENCNNL